MNYLILFFKGLMIGTGKVIPGVSGSILAISFHVYEESIHRLTHFFKEVKNNTLYLGSLGLGILLAILLGSKILLYFYQKFSFYTLIFFLGLMIGTIPTMIKKQGFSIQSILLVILYLIIYKIIKINFILNPFTIFILGMIEVSSSVIPGMSGTSIYLLLQVYPFILELLAYPLKQVFYLIYFLFGILLGGYFILKFMNYALTNHSKLTYIFITSFLFFSILPLLRAVINSFEYSQLIFGILLFILGLFITK